MTRRRTSLLEEAEVEETFDLNVCVQQMGDEDALLLLEKREPGPPQCPPFILPEDDAGDDDEEEQEEEKQIAVGNIERGKGGKGGAKGGGGGGKQNTPSAARPDRPPGPARPRPPVPPITHEICIDRASQRVVGFYLQCRRSPSRQPRLLDASLRSVPGAAGPGGPLAKRAPSVLQTATLVLDSATDLEMVVLALREHEEAEAKGRAVVVALARRAEQERQALQGREATAALLRMHLLADGVGGNGGNGGQVSPLELLVPPPEPFVFDFARWRARGEDKQFLQFEVRVFFFFFFFFFFFICFLAFFAPPALSFLFLFLSLAFPFSLSLSLSLTHIRNQLKKT